MSDVVVRRLRAGETEAFVHSVRVPFLDPPTGEADDRAADERRGGHIEIDRAWVAEHEGRFVGNACIHSLDVTLPASPGALAPVVPMAGVSAVGVHPTHRRRGLLRALMAQMLDDARAKGEAIAGLIASESIIYGRFGFGLSTDFAEFSIDSRESAFVAPAPQLDLRLVDKDEAAKVLPDLFDRQRRGRAGEPGRTELDWDEIIADRSYIRGSHSGVFHAVCDEGYVSYRAGGADVLRGKPANVIVEELRGNTPEVEAALWRFVFDLDLGGQVTAKRRPTDEPIRWRLADPRQLQVSAVDDRLYVRILDMTAAFEARGYRAEGRLVLDVSPPGVDEGGDDAVAGKWVLEAGPDGASCRRAEPRVLADIRLDVTALGSLYMGAYPASLLASAGRIEELTAGSLRAADSLLTTWPAPLTGTGF